MSDTTERIIAAARGWLGTPYRHQASLKGVGCDCLGLVRGVWRDVYGAEPEIPPPYTADWAEASAAETMAEAARRHCTEYPCTDVRPGDLLLFRWRTHLPAKHAGIATPGGKMIHAQDGIAVTEIDLSPWWLRRLAFVFRFPTILPSPPSGEGQGVGTTHAHLTRSPHPQPFPGDRGGERKAEAP